MKISRNLRMSVIVMTFVVPWLIAFMVVAGLPGRTLATTGAPQAVVIDRSAMDTAEGLGVSAQDDHIVIDHNAVDADAIPQAWLDAARHQVVFFNHRSIGNNILDGVADLALQNPTRYGISVVYGHGTGEGINHYMAGSNGDPLSKISGFSGLVKDGHDVAFMKFCVGDFPPWTSVSPTDIWSAYRDAMENVQAQHPNTVIVWLTSPLTTPADGRGLEHFATFNAMVRQYVAENGGVLFDIADIESHDPGGAPITSGGYEAMYNDYSDDGAHLNETGRQRVARAMWWLLARLAGWDDATDWISVTAAANVASIHPGETATYTLTLTAGEGVITPVSLDLQDAPLGTTASFDPNPVTPPGDSQLYITSTASTVVGTYAMTVTGTSGVLSDTANLSLAVASTAPSFTLNISPTICIAKPNQEASYTVTVTGVTGFSQPVTLTVLGLPAGVGKAWSNNPVTPDDLSALTLSIPSRPSFGDHLLMVVGTSETQVVAECIELTIDYPYKSYLPIVLK